MLRGRWAAVAAAFATGAVALIAAGCGGGGSSNALSLDPVAAAATKTQNAGAAHIRFAVGLTSPRLHGGTFHLRGTGAVDGTSSELTFNLGSLVRQLGIPAGGSAAGMQQLGHASMKEILLEQNGDYVVYLRLGALASRLPGHKQWVELDLSKLGKSSGLDLGKLLSGTQFQPSDLLGMLKSEGAVIRNLGPATVDGVATTHYRATIDVGKALQAKGLTSPLLGSVAAELPKVPEDVWIGKDGLVRRVAVSYRLDQGAKRVHVGMRMDLSDYGAAVAISAPPSSGVFDATQLVQGELGNAIP